MVPFDASPEGGKKRLVPDRSLVRLGCPFYGMRLSVVARVMLDTRGNECGLLSLDTKGREIGPCTRDPDPKWPDCQYCDNAVFDDLMIEWGSEYRVSVPEFDKFVTLTDWYEYIVEMVEGGGQGEGSYTD